MAGPIARFTRADSDNATYLAVEGDIDLANVAEFTKQLTRLVDEAHSPAVLDLRRLSFFGSTALHAVLVANSRAEAQGVRLVIQPSPMVLRVIHATGLDNSLHLGGRP